MKRVLPIVRAVALFAVVVGCMLGGIFAAAGVCAWVYGPSILDTALGRPPERGHPAFWLFLIVMVPGMVIGAAGAVFGIVLPVAAKWKVAGFSGARRYRRLFKWYLALVERAVGERSDGGAGAG